MPTFVKTDYVPEMSSGFITAGKEYEMIGFTSSGCYIIQDDEGDKIPVRDDDCAYIDGRPWTVINRP
jgi:hypothetical protein